MVEFKPITQEMINNYRDKHPTLKLSDTDILNRLFNQSVFQAPESSATEEAVTISEKRSVFTPPPKDKKPVPVVPAKPVKPASTESESTPTALAKYNEWLKAKIKCAKYCTKASPFDVYSALGVARQKGKPEPESKYVANMRRFSDEIFQKFDKDGDGSISEQEFIRRAQSIAKTPEQKRGALNTFNIINFGKTFIDKNDLLIYYIYLDKIGDGKKDGMLAACAGNTLARSKDEVEFMRKKIAKAVDIPKLIDP